MSYSPFQSTNLSHSSDNLQNLLQLPFFTSNPISVDPHTSILRQTIDFSAAFIQLHIPQEQSYFQQINSGITQFNSPDQSINHIQDNSFSSLPELIPNLDFILPTHTAEVQTPDLFQISSSIDLDPLESILDTSSLDHQSDPPPYSPSREDPPSYQQPWRREIILRRIRILQSEATSLYRRIDQQRTERIEIYNQAVNTQLREQDFQYATIINHLEDLLELWH